LTRTGTRFAWKRDQHPAALNPILASASWPAH